MPIMDIDRPHHKPITNTNTTTTTTSDLFICFTSLISHSHSHSTSLTTSLSRRLRRNGSLTKRVQSPAMFQTNHHEPSSPKVTCIGQVRGKSRKHGEKMKMLACRSHPPRNQKWVHLPFTICDTLKEFSCLIPCKSSCFSTSNNDGINEVDNNSNNNNNNKGGSSSSCGGVFRWMVSLHDGEGGGRRDVELVVNGDEEELMERSCSRRRSIFDDMEFDDLFNNVGISSNDNDNDNGNGNDGGGGRVSICVPPKNALLLMRCRSDPMRMASLSQKLWDPPLVVDEEVIHDVVVIKEDDDDHVMFESLEVKEQELVEIKKDSVKLEDVGEIIEQNVEDLLVSCEELVEEKDDDGEEQDIENREKTEENREESEEKQKSVKEEGNLLILEETQLVEGLNLVEECSIETITVEEKVEECGNDQELVKKEEYEEIEVQEREESCVLSTNSSTINSSTFRTSLEDSDSASAAAAAEESTELETKVEEKVIVQGEARKSTEKPMLPDCLLLMMCEPKLSMEVSKETWICGTDFTRWLPERHPAKKANKIEAGDDQSSNKKTKASAVAALPPLPPSAQGGRAGIQPGRSSISFPASGGSVANLIEQKLAKAKAGVGLEPFVLTRCKSAPMRSTAKFEPHRQATCGVGAAGVGF